MSLLIEDILELIGYNSDLSDTYFVDNGGGLVEVYVDDIYDGDHFLHVFRHDEMLTIINVCNLLTRRDQAQHIR